MYFALKIVSFVPFEIHYLLLKLIKDYFHIALCFIIQTFIESYFDNSTKECVINNHVNII